MLMVMQEVEREVQEGAGDDGGASRRGRKRRVEEVLEYCYEPEMEATYQRSLLRAFQKVVEEARFKFVVVDAPALKASSNSSGGGNGGSSSGSSWRRQQRPVQAATAQAQQRQSGGMMRAPVLRL